MSREYQPGDYVFSMLVYRNDKFVQKSGSLPADAKRKEYHDMLDKILDGVEAPK